MNRKPRKVLYHPNIEPDINWLKRILLVTDEIVRIVPEDLSQDTSPDFKRFCDVIPGSISAAQLTDTDLNLDAHELERLNKALAGIASSPRQSNDVAITLIVHKDGGIQIEGHSLLHQSKFSGRIGDLLKEHNLLRPEMGFLTKNIGYDDFSVVEERASNLIMSILADRIARRKSWNTISDSSLGFTVNSLNAFEKPTGRLIHSAVVECLIGVAIPANVSDLDLNTYRSLHKSYSDLRSLFQKVTHDIAFDENLADVSNPQELHERLTETLQDFQSEMEAYRKSAFGKKLGRWTRLSFSHLSKIVAAIGVADDAGFLPVKGKILATSGSVVVNILSQWMVSQSPAEDNEEKLIRRLCQLEKATIKRSVVKKLL